MSGAAVVSPIGAGNTGPRRHGRYAAPFCVDPKRSIPFYFKSYWTGPKYGIYQPLKKQLRSADRLYKSHAVHDQNPFATAKFIRSRKKAKAMKMRTPGDAT